MQENLLWWVLGIYLASLNFSVLDVLRRRVATLLPPPGPGPGPGPGHPPALPEEDHGLDVDEVDGGDGGGGGQGGSREEDARVGGGQQALRGVDGGVGVGVAGGVVRAGPQGAAVACGEQGTRGTLNLKKKRNVKFGFVPRPN